MQVVSNYGINTTRFEDEGGHHHTSHEMLHVKHDQWCKICTLFAHWKCTFLLDLMCLLFCNFLDSFTCICPYSCLLVLRYSPFFQEFGKLEFWFLRQMNRASFNLLMHNFHATLKTSLSMPFCSNGAWHFLHPNVQSKDSKETKSKEKEMRDSWDVFD